MKNRRSELSGLAAGDEVVTVAPVRDAARPHVTLPPGTEGRLYRFHRVQDGVEVWGLWAKNLTWGVGHHQVRRLPVPA